MRNIIEVIEIRIEILKRWINEDKEIDGDEVFWMQIKISELENLLSYIHDPEICSYFLEDRIIICDDAE